MAIAKYVYETGHKARQTRAKKRAGGAKNHLIVMPDADIDQATHAIQAAAFGCAGERCMAGSIAVPIGNIADPLVERLVATAGKMRVGPTDNVGASGRRMGPVMLITREHLDKVRGYLDIGAQEGASVALDGRKGEKIAQGGGFLIGPSVIDKVKPEMRVAREEIFGPVLSVMRAG